ncbi:hypothetical protein ACFQ1I_20935 [Kitasatospora arboriphila]
MLRQACSFIQGLAQQIEAIRSDDARTEICLQWEDKISRDWPAHRFHGIISEAASDMGQNSVDPAEFFRRHGQKIREKLSLVSVEADFEREVRKSIERALLTELAELIPVTGTDIMERFGIPPGRAVGELLSAARKIYEERACEKDELLSRLQQIVTSNAS